MDLYTLKLNEVGNIIIDFDPILSGNIDSGEHIGGNSYTTHHQSKIHKMNTIER